MTTPETEETYEARRNNKLAGAVVLIFITLVAIGYSYQANIRIKRLNARIEQLVDNSERHRNQARSLRQKIVELEQQIEDDRAEAETAQEEAMAERDSLWMEAVEKTYRYRWRPESVLQYELTTWNNTQIVAETGWTLHRLP